MASVFIESGERLRFAVFHDWKSSSAEVWDGLTFVVGDDDVEENYARFYFYCWVQWRERWERELESGAEQWQRRPREARVR